MELTAAVTDAGIPPAAALVPMARVLRTVASRQREHAICASCVRELFDPAGRRYRYPFVSCGECAPPASLGSPPYPRVRLAALCQECERECREDGRRGPAAGATGCGACGPTVRWGSLAGNDAIAAAAAAIRAGGAVGVHDVFGDQVVCDARADEVVARMSGASGGVRVLVRNVSAAREIAGLLIPDIRALVERSGRSVVVRVGDRRLSPGVLRATPDVDLFLPRTALQHLLTASVDGPLAVWDHSADLVGGRPYDGVLTVAAAGAGRPKAPVPMEALRPWWPPAA
ncbi:hypothetical protein [Microbispora sp. NPDC049125]|uniref:hypothetical protein n=1 Tax=Microbispora sp. NPDC049125 TaxID=3154929 RepID=UPI003467D36B